MVAMVPLARDRRPVAWELPFIGAGTGLQVAPEAVATLVVRAAAVLGAVALVVMLPGIPGEPVRRRVAALAVMPPTAVTLEAQEVCVAAAGEELVQNPTAIKPGERAPPGVSS